MAYDYHGKWDGFTGHNAPLYPRDDETLDQKVLNVVSIFSKKLSHKIILKVYDKKYYTKFIQEPLYIPYILIYLRYLFI